MAVRCGIVGLPNVGKSTLFNALTRAQIAAQNYPFCTIEPNVGIVPVPDPRLQKLAEIVHPEKTIPTSTEFVDIAGLVAGASKGEGLGNKFLANIRETDAILHVVRCFKNDDIIHVANKIDPVADVETINTELILADMDSIEKTILRLQKLAKSGNKEAQIELNLAERLKHTLNEGKKAISLTLSEDEKKRLKSFQLLTAKPTLYVANVHEEGFINNAYLHALENLAAQEHSKVVPICAALEAELFEMDEAEKASFLKEMNMPEPGLNRVIRESYTLLGLQTYFTAGVKEVRAWTVKKGATAPEAAGVIHTDFEKGFIRAEVIAYEDFIHHGGEQGARDAGKWRLEGKEYIVQEGDVIHFRFNV